MGAASSDISKAVCDRYVERIYHVFDGFAWEEPEQYRRWIGQTYYYVRRATRMIACAASRVALKDEAFHRRLLSEIAEERDHDHLLESDMQQMRRSIADYPELPESAAFYQTLTYLIERRGAFAILGYLVPLEGLGCLHTYEFFERVTKAHGDEAASFLRLHSKLDVEHYGECLKWCAALEPAQEEIVLEALEQCTSVYANLIRAIVVR